MRKFTSLIFTLAILASGGCANMEIKPWVDPDNFNPGYLTRGMHLMPKQGDHEPWVFTQDYWKEKDEFPVAPLTDGALAFE